MRSFKTHDLSDARRCKHRRADVSLPVPFKEKFNFLSYDHDLSILQCHCFLANRSPFLNKKYRLLSIKNFIALNEYLSEVVTISIKDLRFTLCHVIASWALSPDRPIINNSLRRQVQRRQWLCRKPLWYRSQLWWYGPLLT